MLHHRQSPINSQSSPRVEVLGDGRVTINSRRTHYRIVGDQLHVDASEVRYALDAGSIDIGNTWEPFASAAARAGHRKVFDSSQTPALITQVVVAKRRLIETERPKLAALCAAWLEATERWLADVPAGQKRIEAHLGLEPGAASLAGIRLHTLADNRRLLDGEAPALLPVLERFRTFFAERGEDPGDLRFLLEADLLP